MHQVPEAFEMFGKRIARIHAGHISQGKALQIRVLDEGRLLQRCDPVVMEFRHVPIHQRLAGLIVDFEIGIEFQHVQQLENNNKNLIIL